MFIGRENELQLLQSLRRSKKAELGIIYGRRRIGKSTILEKIAIEKGDIYFEAIKGISKPKQIAHFIKQLSKATNKTIPTCQTWEDAFDQLTILISKGSHFIIFDEFAWMASEKKELVAILKYYWDQKWKKNPQLKLVLCSSIANFMIKHLVHSEALHNRKTLELHIKPLLANEAKLFFKNKRSDFEIIKFLITFGGVPKYLEQIDPNFSYEQNLDHLCFHQHAFFLNEFETIFKEQFKVINRYELIIESLTFGPKTKEEIEKLIGITSGGGFTTALKQLETAGFIKAEASLKIETGTKKSKTKKYRLWDEWLKFYFSYIRKNASIIQMHTGPGLARRILEKSVHSYMGIGFEMLCLKNISSILKALRIDIGSVVEIGPYFKQSSRKSGVAGVQIDICILRKGKVLTIIECKYSEHPIEAEVIEEMENKIRKLKIPKSISIEKVLIAACGVTTEVEHRDYFHHILTLDALLQC